MTSLVKESFRVLAARNFRNGLSRVDPSPEILYMTIGREDAWPVVLDSNGNQIVPTSTETLLDDYDARQNLIGIKRVTASNTAYVVPRYSWTSGVVYDEYDATDASLYEKTFYVLTDDLNVYKCIDNNNGAASTIKPTGTATTELLTADGYRWKFLYQIPAAMLQKFLTPSWMPVPHGNERGALQIAVETAADFNRPDSNGYGSPIGGHGRSALEELGGRYVMVYGTFEYDEDGYLPTDISYHQICLWLNPLSVSGTAISSTIYRTDGGSNDIVDKNSGRIIYIENREEISRASDQTEKYRVILKF